jgi:hypothetical protein
MAIDRAYDAQSAAQPCLAENENNESVHAAAELDAVRFAGSAKQALTVDEVPAAVRAYASKAETRQDMTGLDIRLMRKILDPNFTTVPTALAKPLDYTRLSKLGWNTYSAFLVDRIVFAKRYFS